MTEQPTPNEADRRRRRLTQLFVPARACNISTQTSFVDAEKERGEQLIAVAYDHGRAPCGEMHAAVP